MTEEWVDQSARSRMGQFEEERRAEGDERDSDVLRLGVVIK